LGVGVIHFIERTKLVSGEAVVTVCIAVSRAENVGTMIQERRKYDRQREDKTVNGRRILGKTRDSDK
jgi:hypothetical protein